MNLKNIITLPIILPALRSLGVVGALLIPGAINAMEAIELDLGSEKDFKELSVTARLTQEPNLDVDEAYNIAILKRYYTQSNAWLHHSLECNEATASLGNFTSTIEFFFGAPFNHNRTQVVVEYKLKEASDIPPNHETLRKQGNITLTIGGIERKIEHHTPSNELVTLAIAATWKNYRFNAHGHLEEIHEDDN